MNINKSILALILILTGIYNFYNIGTFNIGSQEKNCQTGLAAKIAPWSAGCYFSIDFDEKNLSISKQQIEFEKQRLDKFARKHGVDSEILWYRAKFHRRFMREFRTNFQEIHFMHIDYTLSQHTRLDRQVEYLEFLVSSDLSGLAQETLNTYCDSYLPTYREDVIEEFHWRFSQNRLTLSLNHCIRLLRPSAQARLNQNRAD